MGACRREVLPWSFHREVAALDPAGQDKLLDLGGARWAEVRIGQLLGPAQVGAHSSALEGSDLSPDERVWFRRLAEYEPVGRRVHHRGDG